LFHPLGARSRLLAHGRGNKAWPVAACREDARYAGRWCAYRSDDGRAAACSAEDVSRYADWATELASLLPSGATVADLGCGIGLPATRALTDHRLQVIGIDFSAVQLARARHLVPAARLVQADMTALHLRPASLDAVVSFYALIHVPLADQ
jgi:SAM-dependent methyltransferase